jgi:hypothetical protein
MVLPVRVRDSGEEPTESPHRARGHGADRRRPFVKR